MLTPSEIIFCLVFGGVLEARNLCILGCAQPYAPLDGRFAPRHDEQQEDQPTRSRKGGPLNRRRRSCLVLFLLSALSEAFFGTR